MIESNKPIIAHGVKNYLPVTMNWIYNQLINIKKFKPIVLAQTIENLDKFPYESLYYPELSEWKRTIVKWDENRNPWYTGVFKTVYACDIFRKNNVSLLHTHFGHWGFYDLLIARRLKIPHIITFYGFDLIRVPRTKNIWRVRYKKLFAEGDLFLVEGHNMKKILIETGCPAEKITVNHLGVDLTKIPYQPRIFDGNKVNILVAGRFTEKKGIPLAVKAFLRLQKKYPCLELTLIGDANPQDDAQMVIKHEIMRLIEKKAGIRWLGYVSRETFLTEASEAHIFLSPSLHAADGDCEGGVPVSIIEAVASGMPVLSTWHCDIPEVVIDGENGFLVPEKDADALVEKLEVLVKTPEIWPKLGDYGRKHIEKNYDIKVTVAKLEKIYEDLLRRH